MIQICVCDELNFADCISNGTVQVIVPNEDMFDPVVADIVRGLRACDGDKMTNGAYRIPENEVTGKLFKELVVYMLSEPRRTTYLVDLALHLITEDLAE